MRPLDIVFLPATIQVSGYPPIAGVSVVLNGVVLATSTTSSSHLELLGRQQQVATTVTGTVSDRVRCAACRVWVARSELGGRVLGLSGFCPACVQRFKAECLAANDTLPSAEQFYCRGCQRIAERTDRIPSDADRRQRHRCRACRRAEWRRADRRRRSSRPLVS